MFVESDSFRVFLDSGLLEGMTSEKLWYVHTKVTFRRNDAEIELQGTVNSKKSAQNKELQCSIFNSPGSRRLP